MARLRSRPIGNKLARGWLVGVRQVISLPPLPLSQVLMRHFPPRIFCVLRVGPRTHCEASQTALARKRHSRQRTTGIAAGGRFPGWGVTAPVPKRKTHSMHDSGASLVEFENASVCPTDAINAIAG